MNLISNQLGLIILAIFAVLMFFVTWFFTKSKFHSDESFLVAGRQVGYLKGAMSIAVSWIWAPAIFIVSMQSYTQGLAGAFWFIVPNILCFFLFAPIAIKLRKLMPQGYTVPEFIEFRYGKNPKLHIAFLAIYFGYQLGAVVINTLASGILLSALTGINFYLVLVLVVLSILFYALLSGLEASIVTDVLQMVVVLSFCFIFVPWIIQSAGGINSVLAGFGGLSGEFGSIFNKHIAFVFGIPTTIALLSGPVGDQMFFQRVYASKQAEIKKTFILGGLLFGLVPVLLSSLGFIAANSGLGIASYITDAQMVGPVVVGLLLPKFALVLFLFMALCALASTIDSSYCAISSIGTIDVYKRYFNPKASPRQVLFFARSLILGVSLLGLGIAMLQPKLLWIFLIYGALASSGFFPTIFSICTTKLKASGAFYGIVIPLIFGLPVSVYANITENTNLVVWSSIFIPTISLIICLLNIVFLKNENKLHIVK